MDVFKKIKALNLPLGEYCVVGSGSLFAYGIREARDIDILVTSSLYKILKENGWKIRQYEDGGEYLAFDCFEACTTFRCKNYHPNPKDQIKTAEIIKGVPFLRLEELLKWKREFGRDKDLKDISLIEEYLKNVSSSKPDRI